MLFLIHSLTFRKILGGKPLLLNDGVTSLGLSKPRGVTEWLAFSQKKRVSLKTTIFSRTN